MNATTLFDTIKQELIPVYHPEKIYIFGSYATETPNPESDVDILVIVKSSEERAHLRPIPGRHALRNLAIPKDLMVFTEEEFNARCNHVSELAYIVKHTGKLIYASA